MKGKTFRDKEGSRIYPETKRRYPQEQDGRIKKNSNVYLCLTDKRRNFLSLYREIVVRGEQEFKSRFRDEVVRLRSWEQRSWTWTELLKPDEKV